MKRLICCAVLLLLCVIAITGCVAKGKPLGEDPTFSQALEENGFATNIREDSFIELLGQFQYQDKPLSEYGVQTWSNHGARGVSLSIDGVIDAEYILESNESNIKRTFEYHSTRIQVSAPIKGLVMPYGMSFDSTILDLFKIIGCHIDLPSDFVSNVEHKPYAMKLSYDTMFDDGSSLVLYDYTKVPENGILYPEGVRYSLSYTIPLLLAYPAPVESSRAGKEIVFDFDEKTNKLSRIVFSLWENIEFEDEELALTPTFSDAMVESGLVAGLREEGFVDLLEHFRYHDKPLSDYGVESGNHHGELFTAFCDEEGVFDAEHILEKSFDWKEEGHRGELLSEHYFTTVLIYQPIDGLVMPYGVRFDDTGVFELLSLLGYDIDPEKDFIPQEHTPWIMTLEVTDGEALELIDATKKTEGIVYLPDGMRYGIDFVESYQFLTDDGESAVCSMRMTLYFDENMHRLSLVEYRLYETIDFRSE